MNITEDSCESPEIRGFNAIVDEQISRFTEARIFRRLDDSSLRMKHYHALLTTLFHQTHNGPYTFARAAANCPWRHEAAKEYLLQHAEEERTHWRWMLNDLAATGYDGADPRSLPPHPSCQAFIGLLYHVAEEAPIARLAAAAVLEGIGARHGGAYGKRLLELLNLKSSQASFFLSHGTTDRTHIVELKGVIQQCELVAAEWAWMNHAASTAGTFYRAMYDHEGFA
jgi:hypothetical protein